ncbi:unnamed protein product [Closterium sp. NIES-54]
MFRVWSSCAFVRDTSADKLSARTIPCVFLGFPPDAPGWQFYHPTLLRVLPSQDVTFDESVPFYHLFPYRSAPLPPPPLFLAPGPLPVDPLPPQGPAPSGVSQVDPLPGTMPVEVSVDIGATRGAASGGAEPARAELGGAEPAGAESEGAGSGDAEPGGIEPAGAEPGGAEPEGVEPGGAESEGAEHGGADSEGAKSGGAEPRGSLSPGGPPGALSRREPLSPLQLREWFAWRTCLRSGAAGAGGSAAGGTVATRAGGAAKVGAGGTGAGAAGVTGAAGVGVGGTRAGAAGVTGAAGVGARCTGAGAAGVSRAAGPRGAHPGGTRAAGAGGAAGVGAGDTRAGGAGPGERRGHVSCPASPVRAVCTGRRVPCPRPPPVPSTHNMALRPSSVPQCVPLPSPLASSLADGPDPESGLACVASPTVPHLLVTVVIDPSFESTAVSALFTELVDFATVCRLDYATALVAYSESACPPSVGGVYALGTDVLEDRQEDVECLATAVPSLVAMLLAPERDPDAPDIPTPCSYAEAITGPYSSQFQTAMDAKMASWKSKGTYVDAVPPPGANIVDGMWIFRVNRPPGSPPAFKARYVARGFS